MSEEKYTSGEITNAEGNTIGFYKIQWIDQSHPVHFVIEDTTKCGPLFRTCMLFTSKMSKELVNELLGVNEETEELCDECNQPLDECGWSSCGKHPEDI